MVDCRKGLNAHWHDYVTEIISLRNGNQHAAVGVAEGAVYFFGLHVVLYVEQIGDIESHVEGFAVVIDFHFFLGFFLFAVSAGNT